MMIRASRVDEAISHFRQMRSRGTQPDARTYHLIIMALVKDKRTTEVESFFIAMRNVIYYYHHYYHYYYYHHFILVAVIITFIIAVVAVILIATVIVMICNANIFKHDGNHKLF